MDDPRDHPGRAPGPPDRPPAPGPAPEVAGYAEDEIHLLELVNVLLRRWRPVVGLPLAAAVLTA
ncbi:MAG: hypothetical protein ACREKI_00830, partial [Gemmatimonadota bacterium]